jgi:hypothetical protein
MKTIISAIKSHPIRSIALLSPILLPTLAWISWHWFWWNTQLGIEIGQKIETM